MLLGPRALARSPVPPCVKLACAADILATAKKN